jgi:hypothetical protein
VGRDGAVVVVLVSGDAELASWTLHRGRPDLSVVDSLGRLQLAARRMGCSVRLRSPGPHLLELLELVGLSDLIGEAGLGEDGGQAEDGEEGGVEEVVVADDPVA